MKLGTNDQIMLLMFDRGIHFESILGDPGAVSWVLVGAGKSLNRREKNSGEVKSRLVLDFLRPNSEAH